MSSSAKEAQVITTQPILNSTGAPNMNEGFSQFNNSDPEQQQQVKEQMRNENTLWCCMICEECCDCTVCCIDCCTDTVGVAQEIDNDGSGCGDCFECCADCASD